MQYKDLRRCDTSLRKSCGGKSLGATRASNVVTDQCRATWVFKNLGMPNFYWLAISAVVV